jgi:hypothetical protein
MHLNIPDLPRQAAPRARLTATLLFLSALVMGRAEIAFPQGTAPSAPPHYGLKQHVVNGCHLSTIAFLARYRADFPSEQGEPVVLSLRNVGGVRKLHTVALISWRGAWWCRDEYFGVMPVGCMVEPKPDIARVTLRLQAVLERKAREFMGSRGVEKPVEAPAELSPEQRLREVEVATAIIPFASRIYWVGEGRSAIPVVFFRPGANQIAVYEPVHGTCIAESGLRDDAKVVSLVASRLGYDARMVRADPGIAGGAVMALADAGSVLPR